MRELTGPELFAEMVRFYGIRRGGALIGWLSWVGGMAPDGADRAWVLAHAPGSKSTRYRYVAEVVAFVEDLRSRGLEPGSVGGLAVGLMEATA